ncbi:putative chromate transport protein [Corynebacterium capitovis DSM 44611]|uniref:chromate efflux transporter n=1 Tax=Corynebacterium capitovis TaxID=131081 RepID=UPI001B7F82BC|nr:chromate efflux transporter [Corynebacterium capitovis]WKD57782.1 putative chromate transport protein [Corynebacterium capitovis DSM 44611]
MSNEATGAGSRARSIRNAGEVFGTFLRLGLTSFGGPVAHLGYFREDIVQRRKWMSEREYADLVALCQFLPGPASSQVGMGIGLRRAGLLGMAAAWVAFTFPSVAIMVACAVGVAHLGDISGAGWLVGLKAAAVGVVAQAVYGMSRSFSSGPARATISVGAFALVVLTGWPLIQFIVIVAGLACGIVFLRSPESNEPDDDASAPVNLPRWVSAASLVAFASLLLALPVFVARTDNPATHIFGSFFEAGALVFGGGHVVLPLLEQAVVPSGLVNHDVFLAGYGAAQAVPGPLFTFASFLGASSEGIGWAPGAAIATIAIFLPAALLVLGCLPLWSTLRRHRLASAALAGANSAVVGILGAALYSPVFTSGVHGPATLTVAVASFVALQPWKIPAWAVVLCAAALGAVAL